MPFCHRSLICRSQLAVVQLGLPRCSSMRSCTRSRLRFRWSVRRYNQLAELKMDKRSLQLRILPNPCEVRTAVLRRQLNKLGLAVVIQFWSWQLGETFRERNLIIDSLPRFFGSVQLQEGIRNLDVDSRIPRIKRRDISKHRQRRSKVLLRSHGMTLTIP